MSNLKVETIRDGFGLGLENSLELFCSQHPNAKIVSTSHAFVYIPHSETDLRINPEREIHHYVIWYREE